MMNHHCVTRGDPRPRPATSFWQVVRGCDNRLLAAELIAEFMPEDIAAEIVAEFNARLHKAWLRRCAWPREKRLADAPGVVV